MLCSCRFAARAEGATHGWLSRAELHAGHEVRITCQLLAFDGKRVHYVQEMFHAAEGWLAAVSENMVMHIDMAAKKSAPFPPEVSARIAAMSEAHENLPVPPQVGHKISLPR